ncbi:response regulator [Desulfopila sp. IMCC35008]|uniref:response regulator n=1 Tax=Desulfopila sp. IMCC35008 TaxID=2653858 RepID=UPI0013D8CD21|nr:response regulator [Desulfopila sp. IMCC35008]
MNRPHFLIVDDDEAIRNIFSAIFDDEAHITTASDGMEALSLIGNHKYDVVICDVTMPRLTGLDLYNELKMIKPEVLEKFIFCTGNVTNEFESFCSLHHTLFISKPPSIYSIKTAVKQLLENTVQMSH